MLLKRWLVGDPLKTTQAAHERLSKTLALAIFSSNAISSVAYATDEILLVLILAGSAAVSWSIPVSIAILILTLILTISYRQIIYEYPEGGGAYIVARSNLGELPALIAAGALMIDYILTVAVSVAAGIAALTSAVPVLFPHREALGLIAIFFIIVMVPHIEFTREICRRFNHLYGREPGFEEKARAAIKKLGSKKAKLYQEMRTAFQEQGDDEALESAKAILYDAQNLSLGDPERLFGYLGGGGRMIRAEQALLTVASKMPGLDGQKMSKSYNNTIALRDDLDSVAKKIRTMPTDPARVRRNDRGDSQKCPVWQFHLVYSDDSVKDWVVKGCTSAGIGCLECKQPVIDAVQRELTPIHDRAKHYEENPDLVRNIIADGCEKAQELARETMRDVRDAMGLNLD